MPWSNQSKNSASFSNQSRNSATFDTAYRRGKGLTWEQATQTWTNISETWQDLTLLNYSNQSRS